MTLACFTRSILPIHYSMVNARFTPSKKGQAGTIIRTKQELCKKIIRLGLVTAYQYGDEKISPSGREKLKLERIHSRLPGKASRNDGEIKWKRFTQV